MTTFKVRPKGYDKASHDCNEESDHYYVKHPEGFVFSKDTYERILDEPYWIDVTHKLKINSDGIVDGDHYICIFNTSYKNTFRFVYQDYPNHTILRIERKVI